MNWTANIKEIANVQLSFGNSQAIRLDLKIYPDKNGASDVYGNLTFLQTIDSITGRLKFPYHGITLKNNTNFLLVGTFSPNDNLNTESSIKFLRNITRKLSYLKPKKIRSLLRNHFSKYPNRHIQYRLVTILLLITPASEKVSHFNIPSRIEGKLYEGANELMSLRGLEFDKIKFITEGKIFGVILGFYLSISIIANQILKKSMASTTNLVTISIYSLLMILSFDLVLLLLLPELSEISSKLFSFYIFLFFFEVMLFIYYSPVYISIFKQQFSNQRNIYQILFCISYFMMSSFMIKFFFSGAGLLSMEILISVWVPQILQNMKFSQRVSVNLKYAFATILQRILIIYYISLYPTNIFQLSNSSNGQIVIIYGLITVLFLAAQTYFGPYFFLPKSFKPKPFNYHPLTPVIGEECPICFCPIMTDDEASVTPCNHAFHTECLARWMEEKLICPLCRETIPPFEAGSGFL